MVKTKSQAATAADQVWLAHLVRTAFLVSIVGQIAIAAVGLAFLVSLLALIALLSRAEPQYQAVVFPWISAGAYSAHVGFLIDGLSYTMMLAVTGADLLIHIYSTGYMHDEADYACYFTYLNLFVGAMLIVIMADNYLLVFVDWEGVGLCSYLPIGFWYTRQSAADAGKKAFIVNRIGDFGFMLAILLLFVTFKTTDMLSVQEQLKHFAVGSGVLTAIALLLFTGAVGESAQIPLHVWLLDAMQRPTPVRALIHAATMVTVGVYMVARSSFRRPPRRPLLGAHGREPCEGGRPPAAEAAGSASSPLRG
jgi:NADH-quinone oxidoreductase subunit L